MDLMKLKEYIRDVYDFPKKGILFRDITPLLENPEATEACLQQFLELIGNQKIDKVVSIEARGFFFGILLANRLEAGFVPIRKPGKLPYTTLKEPYQLEYGLDTLEIHQDAIQKGEKVLIHDDVLATGGTALAACRLVEKMGGEIVQVNFLLEIEKLKGREKLKSFPMKTLMQF